MGSPEELPSIEDRVADAEDAIDNLIEGYKHAHELISRIHKWIENGQIGPWKL